MDPVSEARQSSGAESRPGRDALTLAGLLTTTAALYLISIRAPFFYDDVPQIVLNPAMHAFPDLSVTLLENQYPQRLWMNLLYAIAWAAGDGRVEPFHAINLGLHLLNGGLLWAFLARAGAGFPARSAAVALFLLHPI